MDSTKTAHCDKDANTVVACREFDTPRFYGGILHEVVVPHHHYHTAAATQPPSPAPQIEPKRLDSVVGVVLNPAVGQVAEWVKLARVAYRNILGMAVPLPKDFA